jgi:hypothetical protein
MDQTIVNLHKTVQVLQKKTSERSCSMSSEQYCVYTTEVDFAEARFVKTSIFHKSLFFYKSL